MVESGERHRCAPASVRRGEQLGATASRVPRWLVIEQPGPWGRDAFLQSRLDSQVARALKAAAKQHGARVVLARRPGWKRDVTGNRRVYLARTLPAGGWIEHLDVDDDALVRLDLGALRSVAAPGVGQPGPPALTLVCTNGKHDACCADLGRPVARALAEAGVPDVWECSHIGGDRFAANVVSLPHGVYLGRVTADAAPHMMRELLGGMLDLDHYRGRSCFPTFVQAAELVARRELSERRLDALVLLSSEEVSDDQSVTIFRHATGTFEVRLGRRRGEPSMLTCSGGIGRPWITEFLDFRAIS